MAKYECNLQGDFDDFLHFMDVGIIRGSTSASFEDGSDYASGGVRCAVRVYERYSFIGSNRLSLSITLAGHGDDLFVSAITAGGSQAMFFKVNTFGEENFLRLAVDLIDAYQRQ
ncbi:MAG: DUF6054 family protein [Clostridiales bacterium]|nr:DUF6054 family protein [Clostridiales bacterium]